MRKLNILLALLLIVGLMAGCANSQASDGAIVNGDLFKITEENGKYYLHITDKAEKISPSVDQSVLSPIVYFSSLSEMVSDIKTNNFSDGEIYMIQKFRKDDAGRIEVCNLKKLYEPVVPEPYTLKHVGWSGLNYLFYYHVPDKVHCSVYPLSKSDFDSQVESDWTNFKNRTDITSVETEAERNAQVYYRKWTSASEEKTGKHIQYTITDGNKTIYVSEKYNFEVSTTVPFGVELWISNNGGYLNVRLSVEERPSLEWFSRFDVIEYVETTIQ